MILQLNKIYCMDCIEGMEQLDNNSVDTIITDPPYGLSFMGKRWDYDVPSIEIWKECLRVLKPGGTALIFAGSRTQHRVAVNIEDAGFILKDCIMWLYGSGFPKASDISKQLDKKAGVEQELEEYEYPQRKNRSANYNIGFSDSEDRKKEGGSKIMRGVATSKEAQLWNGWKSHGLKPAYEPIIVAMKPNEGSYADNALKHGVSGLNIDGGRIGTEKWKHKAGKTSPYGNPEIWDTKGNTPDVDREGIGRYPSNIILDEESAKVLDEQVPETSKGYSKATNGKASGEGSIFKQGGVNANRYDMGGLGASRFFYVAKASKAERNRGLDDFEKKSVRYEDGSWGSLEIFSNQYTEKSENPNSRGKTPKHQNIHPTVKPLKLMEYLCILTRTPTGGTVLDPFAGSGTTGMACKKTGRDYILIEKEPEYVEIANARLNSIGGKQTNIIQFPK